MKNPQKLNSRLWRYFVLMFIRGSTIVLKFGLSLYIAKFVGLAELGTYGLVVALSLTAPVLIRAGLFNTISRNLVDAEPAQMTNDLKHYMAWVIICYLVIATLMTPLLYTEIISEYKNSAYLILAIVLGEHLTADSIVLLNNLRKPQSANFLGLNQSAVCVIPFAALSWFIPSLRNLNMLLACWAIANFISLFGVVALLSKWPWKTTNPINIGWYFVRLKASGYLFASDLIGTASQFIDRYLIAYFISIEQAGIYTLFFQLANSIYTLISSSIINVHRPQIISAFRSKDLSNATSHLKRLQLEVILIFAALSIIIGGAFYFVAPWLNRPKVLDYLPLMWFTFIATALKAWCLTGFIELFSRHYDRELFLLNILGFILIIAASIGTIFALGIYGIPVGIGLTYIILLYLIRITVKNISKTKEKN